MYGSRSKLICLYEPVEVTDDKQKHQLTTEFSILKPKCFIAQTPRVNF